MRKVAMHGEKPYELALATKGHTHTAVITWDIVKTFVWQSIMGEK